MMAIQRRLSWAAATILAACAFTACVESTSQEFKIRVTGTEGLSFTAMLGSSTIGGMPDMKQFDGTVPADYSLTGSVMSCTFQKPEGEAGELVVEILRNGKTVSLKKTSKPGGVIIAAVK